MNNVQKLYVFLVLVFMGFQMSAHEIRPGYLEITEVAPNTFSVFWKQPISGESGIHLMPVLSSGWLTDVVPINSSTGTTLIREWTINSTLPLEGQTITIEGLKNTITDVLVRIEFADGVHVTRIIRPSEPFFVISESQSALPVLDYLRLGVEHILFGIDHLLFVLALILLVRGKGRLLKTITAFTIAHSITLAAATLGWVNIPTAPVEAVIALSIIFLAVELVHYYQGKKVFSSQYPWVVAFIFGLLHGFGFAGALAHVGLPQNDIPLTLFLFNVGVELGQLFFVFVILIAIWGIHKIVKKMPTWALKLPAYAIGCMAAFWFFERLTIIYII